MAPSTTSTCCIARLPPEIATLVCYDIGTKDIYSLRLVSKFWNSVVTPFMRLNVNFHLNPESFQRLLDGSRQPVISKRIISLYYEPIIVIKYVADDSWKEAPISDTFINVLRPYDQYSRHLLQTTHEKHTQIHVEQKVPRNEGYGVEELSDVISRLPNLSEICMNGWLIPNRSRSADNDLAAGLDRAQSDHCSIQCMRSLLLAVHQAGTKLRVLKIDGIDWKFLQQSNETLECMKSTLSHLRSFGLSISPGYNETETDIGVEIPSCGAYLSESTRLVEFLASAPNLEDLTVGCGCFEHSPPPELRLIFGNTVWPCLQSIALDNIDAESKHLKRFFEQHASTLEHVTFQDMVLVDGRWIEVLEKMVTILKLKSASTRGELIGENPCQRWDLEPGVGASYDDLRCQGNRTSKAFQDYLVQGGSCPLIDEVAHPQCHL